MVATMRVRLVLDEAQIAPTDLSVEEWGTLLYEILHHHVTLDFVRGMQSIRQLLEPAARFDVMYRASPSVIRAGLSGTGLKSDDVFLYCTTTVDTTYPQKDLAERAKNDEIFRSSHVVLRKKGAFWKIHTDWRYTRHSKETPNPWGINEPWLDAQTVKLEYIRFGQPLGNLCLEEVVRYNHERAVGPLRLNDLVGGRILYALRDAHGNTSKELAGRAERTRIVSEYLGRCVATLGR